MAFCSKCGTQLDESAKFCPSCGAATTPAPNTTDDFFATVQTLNDTPDTTAQFDQADIAGNKGMAILSYLVLLVLIPIFAAKGSKFARFHANQGLVLAIAEIVCAILARILRRIPFIGIIFWILDVLFLVLAILGIVNAANGKAKELPVIGNIKLIQ